MIAHYKYSKHTHGLVGTTGRVGFLRNDGRSYTLIINRKGGVVVAVGSKHERGDHPNKVKLFGLGLLVFPSVHDGSILVRRTAARCSRIRSSMNITNSEFCEEMCLCSCCSIAEKIGSQKFG